METLTILERHDVSVAIRRQITLLWSFYKFERKKNMNSSFVSYLRSTLSRLISAYRKLFV